MSESQLQEAGFRWRKLTAEPETALDLQAELEANRQAAYEEGLAQGLNAANDQVQRQMQALQGAIDQLAQSHKILQEAAVQEGLKLAQMAFEAVFQNQTGEDVFSQLTNRLLAGLETANTVHVGAALFASIDRSDVIKDESLPEWALGVDVDGTFQQLDVQANVREVLQSLAASAEVQMPEQVEPDVRPDEERGSEQGVELPS